MENNEEIWKPVLGYENFYEISNIGNIRSVNRVINNRLFKGQLLKPRNKENKEGNYLTVSLKKDSNNKTKFVHRLVAESFIENPNNFPHVNHIDENKLNNSLENLEWCDAKYNCNYGNRNNSIIETKFKNGMINPEMVGLTKSEYVKIYRKKYKIENQENAKAYQKNYYIMKKENNEYIEKRRKSALEYYYKKKNNENI
jgi:hypothetical protein